MFDFNFFFTPKIILTIMIKNLEKLQFLFYSSSFIMEPEQKLFYFFGSSSYPSRIKRLRLLVNCKAENYEFVTTKKKYFLPWYKITECSTLGTTFCIREENRVSDPHFFADPDPDPWGIRGRGWGVVVKGKNDFFLVFFSRFRWF